MPSTACTEPSKNIIEFRSGDIASFWLLHTASSACAALTHLLRNPASPERLFHELLRLAGGLMTFSGLTASTTCRPTTTPSRLALLRAPRRPDPRAARHRDLHLHFAIALTQPKPGFHAGRPDSDKIDGNTAFFLSVSAALPQSEIIESVPCASSWAPRRRRKAGVVGDGCGCATRPRCRRRSQVRPGLPTSPSP